MAKRTRPFLVTGAALASAVAIVTASPAILPTNDVALAASSTPTPAKISYAKYELTALSDITIQGINDAYWFGWGGYIGACCTTAGDPFDPDVIYPPDAEGNPPYVSNPYYPGVNGAQAVYDPDTGDLLGYRYNQGGVYNYQASGVAYYLLDNALESFVPGFDLDNYYFEIGAPALPYVAAGEIFGTSSPIFQAAQSVFYYGVPNVINSVIVSASQLVPTFDIGPVTVGGGRLTSLYYYGYTPDGSFAFYDADGNYQPGLSAILAYISTSISDSLPSAAALSGAASAAAAAIQTVVNDVEGAVKALTPGAATPAAAKTSAKTVAAEAKTESTDTTTTTEGTSSTGGSSTEGTSSTEGSSTEGSSSTEDSSTGTSSSTGVASSAKPATAAKTTKPAAKPQNPLAKLGKRISDALSGGKKAKSESSSSSDSSSSGDSGGSSTGGSAK